MKVEITKAQLEAIKNMTDDYQSMIENLDRESFNVSKKNIVLVDRFLKKNNTNRYFND